MKNLLEIAQNLIETKTSCPLIPVKGLNQRLEEAGVNTLVIFTVLNSSLDADLEGDFYDRDLLLKNIKLSK
jgi:hypothetical protein